MTVAPRLDSMARRILRALTENGPRKATVLSGLRGARGVIVTRAVFEKSIGQLFLGGYIKAFGKTRARTIGVVGRRSC